MKSKIKILLLILLIARLGYACDVCGGAMNTGGSDIIPGMYRHFIGLRGNLQSFSSEHLTLFPGEEALLSKEWFINNEIYGRYVPVRRIHLNAALPYNALLKVENNSTFRSTHGIGDARFSINFLVLENQQDESKIDINWFSGIGIKLPTGEFEQSQDQNLHFHPNMLPGTGTYDFFAHSDFIFSNDNWGGTLNAMYMLRGTNKLEYSFGDIFSSRITSFYKHSLKKDRTLMLELGLTFSHIQADKDLRWNETQPYSEGSMLAPNLRASYFMKDWVFQLGANKAVYQNLAQGQVQQNYQLEVSLLRFF
jgi:hypothetical protein